MNPVYLSLAAFLVTMLLVVTIRRYELNKLARTAMIAAAFGLYLCARFAERAVMPADKLTIFAIAVIMMSLAFSSWKERRTMTVRRKI